MTPPIEAAKARLTELEVRLPWTSVKKSWGPRREQWVSQVLAIVTSEALGAQLLSLEAAIKSETLEPTWQEAREGWKGRVGAAHSGEAVERLIIELERAVQWKLLQLNRAGTVARPLPPATACDGGGPPPEGVPRAALRIMLLLRAMGVRSYSPAVALQLYEVAHAYGAELLHDASHYARARRLHASALPTAQSADAAGARKRPLESGAPELDGPIETADVALAARMRAARAFVPPPPREVLAQHAAECNLQPLTFLGARPSGLRPPPTDDERGGDESAG